MSLLKQLEYNKGLFVYRVIIINKDPLIIIIITGSLKMRPHSIIISNVTIKVVIIVISIIITGSLTMRPHSIIISNVIIKDLVIIAIIIITGSLTMRRHSIYLTCTHTLPRAIPTLETISLVCLGPRTDVIIFKTNIAFSGAFLWNNLPLTVRFCHSLSFFKQKLRVQLEAVT